MLTAPYRWLVNVTALREKQPFDMRVLLAIVAFVAWGRMLLEGTMCNNTRLDLAAFVVGSTFYFLAAMLFSLAGALLIRESWERVARVVPLGLFVGLAPPIIDRLLGNPSCRYAYNLGFLDGWSWAIYSPQQGRPAGETMALWGAVAFLGLYTWVKTRSPWRTGAALVAGYLCVFVVVSFSSSLARSVVNAVGRSRVPMRFAHEVIITSTFELLLITACYLAVRPGLARRLGARLLHAAPFLAVLLLGAEVAAFAQHSVPESPWRVLGAVLPAIWLLLGWLANLVQNDHFDADSALSLTRDDVWFFDAVAWIGAAEAFDFDPRVGGLLALFNLTAAIYNRPFYRGKRWFPSNYKIEGVWGWTAFMLGAEAMTPQLRALPTTTVVASGLVFGGWSLFNAFKDYKDIHADHRAGVQTAYVLAYRAGWRLRRLHLTLRWALLAGALLPVGLCAAMGIRWPALALAVVGALALFFVLGREPRPLTVRLALVSVTAYVVALAVGFAV